MTSTFDLHAPQTNKTRNTLIMESFRSKKSPPHQRSTEERDSYHQQKVEKAVRRGSGRSSSLQCVSRQPWVRALPHSHSITVHTSTSFPGLSARGSSPRSDAPGHVRLYSQIFSILWNKK